jgi:aminoglycoside phosphotransferase (APT) family kinase protein
MIPDDKSSAVSRALNEAFGTSTIDSIEKMTRGLSSDLVFRIVVHGSPFLLRILTQMDERNDPARVFTCMQSAADAGVAPRVHYSSVQDGIAIIEWIEDVPFPRTEALIQLPALIRRLHGLAPFPKTFNYVTAHKFFIWRFRSAGLVPEDEVKAVFERYDQICAAYPRLDSDMVSCHQDLKPENILFDGRRPWLIDWQAAFVNDRYFDLAVPSNFVVANDAEECVYLERYLGEPAEEYRMARFFLMRQALHLLSATVFLLLGSKGKPLPQGVDVPPFREFHDRIWAGEIDLRDHDLKITYGLVHWVRLVQNLSDSRFDESLRRVASQNRGAELLFPGHS